MKTRTRRGILTSLAALAAACALAPGASAITLPAGFEHHPELTGLSRPVKIAWAPDGRRFVIEKDGVLRAAPATGTTSQVLLDLRSEVNNVGDRGMLGLAVDTDFAGTHPYLYVLYTYDVKKATTPDSDAGTVSRLIRLKLNASNQILENKVVLGSYISGVCPSPDNSLDCIPSDGTSHSIGTVISNPDGSLWVGSGDAAGFTELDPLSLRTFDEQSMAGKILHVDRDGKGLANHPYCQGQTDLTKVCTKVYAKGFRNPYRFTRRPNGILMVGDVGWNSDEEMDGVWRGGRNFGWPCYEGVIHTPSWKDRPECQAEYAREETADNDDWPLYAYSHTGGNAIIAGPEYTGGPYPDAFDGTLFFGDYAAGFIKRMKLTPDGGNAGIVDFATGWTGVDLTLAPNDELVYADPADWSDGGGTIERITYTPGNRAPTAVAGGTPLSGDPPLAVHFSSAGSSDPDGNALAYDWNYGDGSAHGTTASPTHTYSSHGSYTATLTVSDGQASDTDTVQVNVSNTPPVPHISTADGALYRDGVPVTVSGTVTDDAPGSTLHWDVILHHGTHTHPAKSADGSSVSFTPFTDHDSDSYYEIRLTARDADSAAATAQISMYPETIPFHLRSEPSGAPLSYAGTTVTAPADRTTAIGFMTAVSADASFEKDGVTWEFDHWSDGGDRAHVFPAPDTETTLIAVYEQSAGPLVEGPVVGQQMNPPVEPSDTQGPRIGFDLDRGMNLRRHLLRGVADDGSGVKAVSVAMARMRAHGCQWMAAKPARLARKASSCSRPRWLQATVKGRRWTVALPKNMAQGTYRVRFRAGDMVGNRSDRLRDGSPKAKLRVFAAN